VLTLGALLCVAALSGADRAQAEEITEGDNEVTLAWDANSESDLAGYKVYYQSESESDPTVKDVGNVTTTTISNLEPGETYTIYVTAYNTSGLESDPSNQVTYTVLNQVPSAVAQSVSMDEDTSVAITLSGSDPEGRSLSYSVVTQPSEGTLSGTAPDLTYSPGANYNGTDSFTFKVNDGLDDSEPATVSVDVTPVSDPPVALNDSVERVEGESVKMQAGKLIANDYDVDGDTLSLASVSSPTVNGATVVVDGGWVIYMPPSGFAEADQFTYQVVDGTGESAVGTVNISVRSAETENKIIEAKLTESNTLLVQAVGIPGRTYAIQASESLTDAQWETLATRTAGPNGVYEYEDVNGLDYAVRYYRAIEP
jgi:hypothetical protein